jgi:peptidyl-dipeptidase Dcp
LSRGNTEDLQKMYSAWLGAEPTTGPMLKHLGLVEDRSEK